MSLLVRLILGVVGLIAVAALLASNLLQRGFGASYAQIERDAAQHEMQRLVSALEIEARSLSQLLLGWAHWSELYAYVGTRDAAFRRDNLSPATLAPSDLDWVLVIGANGELLDAVAAVRPAQGLPDLARLKAPGDPLFAALRGPLAADAQHCGVAVLAGVQYLACRMPIRDTTVMQPPRGMVVLGRRFDARMIQRVRKESQLDFALAPASNGPSADEVAGAPIASPVFGHASPLIRTLPDTLELRLNISDLNAKPFGALVLHVPREISALGRSSLHKAQLELLALAMLIGVLLIFAVDRILVYRLRRLTADIDRIRTEKNWSLRVDEQRHDEIGRLAAHTNALLGVIDAQVQDLEKRATTDSLTGLANRRAFSERLEQAIRRQQRSGAALALIMLDIDAFKAFNDRYGHAAGDRALEQVGTILQSAGARVGDLSARLGGEEFAILVENTSPEGALTLAQHVRLAIEALGIAHKTAPHGRLTVSIGLAVLQHGESGETLYQRADAALYRAKEEGRNRVAVAREGMPVLMEAGGRSVSV
ncbi:diguanylate cyclase [Niveibacterium umoris]|uniref:diguanylate cyclase n=1 Tax=Niveibacterium umoris TaxID=1193620 RepID=A0A840BL25_9RHOO|nr:diguanylate cyclase [Niveibacterium umoris]MBB4013700.1 diguanylate cyclase (GGDEF)-like protein [Niveibacterium umoris]